MHHPLVEVGFGDLKESAVTVGFDGEDKRLPREHGQLAHHLPRLSQEEAHIFSLVNHPLIDMKAAPQDKVQADILPRGANTKENKDISV